MYKDIYVSGMPWQEPGTSSGYGKSSLTSKILCARHNSGLSVIDSAAGRAFEMIQRASIHATKKSLSRKPAYFLINGDLFELWGLKTLLGLYHAKIMLNDGKTVIDSYDFDSQIAEIGFFGPGIIDPLGMNISPDIGVTNQDRLGLAPLISEDTKSVGGISIEIRGISFKIIFDRRGGNPVYFRDQQLYRPTILDISGPKRTSRIIFAWGGQKETVTRVNITLSQASAMH